VRRWSVRAAAGNIAINGWGRIDRGMARSDGFPKLSILHRLGHDLAGSATGERVMAKPRRTNSARTPPVPSESHAQIDDRMRRLMPDLQPVVERLDGSIREKIPGLRYAVKSKRAYYGFPALGWIIERIGTTSP
jgi:hypothetical protein